jgi:phytanoyl-CoA hydroxylase
MRNPLAFLPRLGLPVGADLSNMEYFGHQGEILSPKQFFIDQNYIICRNALDGKLISDLIAVYDSWIQDAKDNKYLRQSGLTEANEFSAAGGVKNCFLNPHTYKHGCNRKLSRLILSVLASPGVSKALTAISGHSRFSLYQSMLFDHTTTRPHQDWIYLDSRPVGHLIAAWVALEDIHLDGIRFYVYPGSQHFRPASSYNHESKDWREQYDSFLSEIDQELSGGQWEMYAPSLLKGDIFFWGSRIIHGSVQGSNPDRRRRSIAAHFVPDGFKFGNLEKEIEVRFGRFGPLSYADSNLD